MRKGILLTVFAIIATLGLMGGIGWAIYQQLADTEVSVKLETPLTTTYRSERDITYCSPGGMAQKLDLHIPDSTKQYPLLVYVHGGGWYAGSKESAVATDYISEVARLGYVVASINYRLVPEYTFPSQIEDTKCAIRFLRANADKYQIDAARVGILGESAGGYLAALAGTSGNNTTFKTAEYAAESDDVQAVVDLFGPTTFVGTTASASATRMAKNFLGTADPTAASAGTYATQDDPPFLIVHGDADKTVPLEQSQLLHAQLQQVGVSSELLVVRNGGHGLSITDGQPLTPNLGNVRGSITAFLARHLKQ
ncbi:MAG TPA: alpha/beta hydrolase [Candidatus Saccharimonadales bacterium]|nr:alpha/beta hydrolase [Candidatus Saccharimonadales bacterium]